MLSEVPAERFDAYLEAERRAGERYLVDTGRVEWVVSFAPIAPAELRAFARGIASPAQADEDLIVELAHGLTIALTAYAEMGFESFNLATYGAPPEADGYPLNLRLACRSNLKPFYRSDSTLLERLHWEGAIDLRPEEVAERIGGHFRV
jgi:galactose-1-phosphate uridylyltransferase